MNWGGTLVFKGKGCFWSVEKNAETNLVDLAFDVDGNEFFLSFEPACLKTIVDALGRFLLTGERTDNPAHDPENRTGKIHPDIYFGIDDDKASIRGEWDEIENNPGLFLEGKNFKIELFFNVAQAKEIETRCRKIQEVRKSIKDVTKKKTVQASA